MAKYRLYREELHERVWTEPMSEVAARYGVSEETLRQYCSDLRVPFPTDGYWEALRQGKKMKRAPLPDHREGQKESVETTVEEEQSSRKTIAQRLREVIDGTPTPDATSIAFEIPDGYKWHTAIRPVRKQIIEAASDAAKRKAKYDWERAHPGKRYSSKEFIGGWGYAASKGGVLGAARKPMIRATLQTYEYALFLANEVCVRAEARGFAVKADDQRSRIELHRDTARVDVRVVEKMRSEIRKRTGAPSDVLPTEQVMHATGRIELRVAHPGNGEAVLPVRQDVSFEAQWPKILVVIEQRHMLSLKQNEIRAEREREYAEASARWEEERLQKEKLREEAERNQKRREHLLQEAEQWERVDRLRRFLAELDAREAAGGEPCSGFQEWRDWAEAVANDLDSKRVTRPSRAEVRPMPEDGR